MKRFLVVCALAVLGACDLNTDPANEPTDPATETFASSLQVNIATMTKTTSGAYYRDLVLGGGDALAGVPTVVISYVEYLKTGVVVRTVSSGVQPLTAAIPGLQEGVQGMRPNGERLIVIPSALAYGNSNTVPGVPPNSTLVFDLIFKGYPVQ